MKLTNSESPPHSPWYLKNLLRGKTVVLYVVAAIPLRLDRDSTDCNYFVASDIHGPYGSLFDNMPLYVTNLGKTRCLRSSRMQVKEQITHPSFLKYFLSS